MENEHVYAASFGPSDAMAASAAHCSVLSSPARAHTPMGMMHAPAASITSPLFQAHMMPPLLPTAMASLPHTTPPAPSPGNGLVRSPPFGLASASGTASSASLCFSHSPLPQLGAPTPTPGGEHFAAAAAAAAAVAARYAVPHPIQAAKAPVTTMGVLPSPAPSPAAGQSLSQGLWCPVPMLAGTPGAHAFGGPPPTPAPVLAGAAAAAMPRSHADATASSGTPFGPASPGMGLGRLRPVPTLATASSTPAPPASRDPGFEGFWNHIMAPGGGGTATPVPDVDLGPMVSQALQQLAVPVPAATPTPALTSASLIPASLDSASLASAALPTAIGQAGLSAAGAMATAAPLPAISSPAVSSLMQQHDLGAGRSPADFQTGYPVLPPAPAPYPGPPGHGHASIRPSPPSSSMQPTQPMQPMQPIHTMQPMQPMQPLQPLQPLQSMQSMQPMSHMPPMDYRGQRNGYGGHGHHDSHYYHGYDHHTDPMGPPPPMHTPQPPMHHLDMMPSFGMHEMHHPSGQMSMGMSFMSPVSMMGPMGVGMPPPMPVATPPLPDHHLRRPPLNYATRPMDTLPPMLATPMPFPKSSRKRRHAGSDATPGDRGRADTAGVHRRLPRVRRPASTGPFPPRRLSTTRLAPRRPRSKRRLPVRFSDEPMGPTGSLHAPSDAAFAPPVAPAAEPGYGYPRPHSAEPTDAYHALLPAPAPAPTPTPPTPPPPPLPPRGRASLSTSPRMRDPKRMDPPRSPSADLPPPRPQSRSRSPSERHAGPSDTLSRVAAMGDAKRLDMKQHGLEDYTPASASEAHSVLLPSDTGKPRKMYPCLYPGCDRAFPRFYNLKSHLLCHSQVKPHRCDHCTACFARKHDLQRHRRTIHRVSRGDGGSDDMEASAAMATPASSLPVSPSSSPPPAMHDGNEAAATSASFAAAMSMTSMADRETDATIAAAAASLSAIAEYAASPTLAQAQSSAAMPIPSGPTRSSPDSHAQIPVVREWP